MNRIDLAGLAALSSRLVQAIALVHLAAIACSAVILLPGGLVLGQDVPAAAAAGPRADDVSAMVGQITGAKSPRDARRRYQTLFNRASQAALGHLKLDGPLPIRLTVAWKETERALFGNASAEAWVKSSAAKMFEPDPNLKWPKPPAASSLALAEFAGFLQGAARVSLPSWWKQRLCSGMRDGPNLMGYDMTHDVLEYFHLTGLGLRAEPDASIKIEGGRATVARASRSVAVPVDVLGDIIEGDCISIVFNGGKCYLAIYSGGGFPFELLCINTDRQALEWKAEVWAADTSALQGVGFQRVELVADGGRLLVFGGEAHAMYVEEFDPKSGANKWRFSTMYYADDRGRADR